MTLATVASAAERAAAGPVLPTQEELALLGRTERAAVRIAEYANRHRRISAMAAAWLWYVNQKWVWYATRKVTHVFGADELHELERDRGVLVCSNHRSFFDQFVVMTYYSHTIKRLPRLFFPVRSNYFYERWSGIFLNGAMAGFRMYPPIFRDARKAAFNRYSQARLVELLAQPDAVVGVHPEGRRSKGSDPYTLLPAQLGVGQLIMEARPTVIPVFVNGLSNNFLGQLAGSLRGTADPIVIVFGQPLELDLDGFPKRLRAQKELAERVLEEIRRLGEKERKIRTKLLNPLAGAEK